MPDFNYQGVDRAGKKVTGSLTAQSDGDLRMLLREMGVRPTKIGLKSQGAAARTTNLTNIKVPTEEVVNFTRQLQVLIGSGIPLVQALEILSDQAGKGAMRNVAIAIRIRVSEGSYLWETLALYPKTFPKIYVSLIRAGESSGSMDSMLKRLSVYLEEAEAMQKMLKSAMMYPIIVMAIASGVIGLMMVFVIPKFEVMLKGNHQELPGPTQFVITLSHFIINNIVFIIPAIALTIFLFRRFKASEEGRIFLDRLTFKLPLFGPLAQKAGVARFSRTMQTLLMSGVNLIDAIDICKATIDNAVLEEAVGTIRAEIEQGKTLGAVFTKLPVFPRMAIQMISVGESTGALDKMLEKVADFYEAEVEVMIQGLTKLIEPLVLVVLGGIVGGIMVAMYLPIFKMAGGGSD